MKRIKFKIANLGDKVYTITIPDLSLINNSREEIYFKIFNIINYCLLFIFFFSLPLSQVLYKDAETIIFQNLIIFTILMLSIHFATVLIFKKKFIDPPNFIPVLLFALFTTLSSVFTVNYGVSNTFGKLSFRSSAGLTIMLIVGIYYLINFYILDKISFKKIIGIVSFSFLVSTLILALNSIGSGSSLNENLNLLVFLIPVVFLNVNLTKNKIISFIQLIILTTIFILNLRFGNKDLSVIFILILVSLLSILPSYVIYVVNKKEKVRLRFLNILNNRHERKIVEDLFFLIFIFTPFILLIINIVILLLSLIQKNYFINQYLFNLFNNYKDTIRSLIYEDNTNISSLSKIVFGQGGDKYSSNLPLILNVLNIQGVLGFISYVFIWIFGIFTAINLLLKIINKNKYYKFIIVLIWIICFVPILSFFEYPGIILILFWWFSFALISLFGKRLMKDNIKIDNENIINTSDNVIKSLDINNNEIGRRKVINYLRYLISLIILFIGIFLIYQLLQYLR